MPQISASYYNELFEQFQHLRAMVLGDVMVDAYLFGHVERISPEAPVPVVQVDRRINRLGGAANVALNIKSLGAEPVLCSVIGNDQKGREFMQLLKEEGIQGGGIIASTRRITTTKFRIIGNKAQMLRVDEEMTDELDQADQAAFLKMVFSLLEKHQISIIIFQDYDKGVLTPVVIRKIIEKAGILKIPVAVDPKNRNFMHYKGADLFKPNLKELREGLNRDIRPDHLGDLEEAAMFFHEEKMNQIVMTTLSDKGVFVSQRTPEGNIRHEIIPAHVRNIADVSGAGDTVISVAALCLACGVGPSELAGLSNLAGGLVCEEVGVVPVNRDKLLREIINLA
jgi:rfaE bifunctional protein kinase chain/domain